MNPKPRDIDVDMIYGASWVNECGVREDNHHNSSSSPIATH